MSSTKEKRRLRAHLVANGRAIIDAAERVRRKPSATEMREFDSIMASADALGTQIERQERLEDLERDLNARVVRRARAESSAPGSEREAGDYADARVFETWARFGMEGLNENQRALAKARIVGIAGLRLQNAQGVGSNPGGGYTVPPAFLDQLIDAETAYGGMLAACNVMDTADGRTMQIPTDNDTSNAGALMSENTQASEQDIPFGAISLFGFMYTSKLVNVSYQLLQDSDFDFNAIVPTKLGARIARGLNADLTNGSGVAKPQGLLAITPVGVVAPAGETTTIKYDDLFDLEHSVDPAYRAGPKVGFMLHDKTLGAIKKLKDGQGRYLWNTGTESRSPDTINGYPYTVNQDFPTMTANAKSIAFGDFSYYWIRRIAGAQVLRLTERYADYAQVGYVAFQRWDGAMVDAGTHPIKLFQNAAN